MSIEAYRWLQDYEVRHHGLNHTEEHGSSIVVLQQEQQDEDDADLVPIIYKILAVAWILFMALVCYKAGQREQEEGTRRREIRSRRRQQRINAIKFAPGRRQAVVSAALITRKMTDSKTTGVMLENQGDAAIQEDNEDMTCTICLDPFKVGEELSFSRHLKCHHCFHSHCVIPWMMQNDDCPMCRTQLIVDDGKDINVNDDDFDDEDDTDNDGFRIVNGLVRFASMLRTSQVNDRSDESELVHSIHGMEMEMVNIVTPTPTAKRPSRKNKRRNDKRNYKPLPTVADVAEETSDSNDNTHYFESGHVV